MNNFTTKFTTSLVGGAADVSDGRCCNLHFESRNLLFPEGSPHKSVRRRCYFLCKFLFFKWEPRYSLCSTGDACVLFLYYSFHTVRRDPSGIRPPWNGARGHNAMISSGDCHGIEAECICMEQKKHLFSASPSRSYVMVLYCYTLRRMDS